jgi:hypothetical protein
MNRLVLSRTLSQSQICRKIIASRVTGYCSWIDSYKANGLAKTESHGELRIKSKNISNKYMSSCTVNGAMFQSLDYGEPIEFDIFLER